MSWGCVYIKENIVGGPEVRFSKVIWTWHILMDFSFTGTKQNVVGVTKMEEQISRAYNIFSCKNSPGTYK